MPKFLIHFMSALLLVVSLILVLGLYFGILDTLLLLLRHVLRISR